MREFPKSGKEKWEKNRQRLVDYLGGRDKVDCPWRRELYRKELERAPEVTFSQQSTNQQKCVKKLLEAKARTTQGIRITQHLHRARSNTCSR